MERIETKEIKEVISNIDTMIRRHSGEDVPKVSEEVFLYTLSKAYEVLEKQIPKNPYIWGDGYYNGELILDMYDCPNCEKSYETECDKYDYCPSCGQKIDWSEADEKKL